MAQHDDIEINRCLEIIYNKLPSDTCWGVDFGTDYEINKLISTHMEQHKLITFIGSGSFCRITIEGKNICKKYGAFEGWLKYQKKLKKDEKWNMWWKRVPIFISVAGLIWSILWSIISNNKIEKQKNITEKRIDSIEQRMDSIIHKQLIKK